MTVARLLHCIGGEGLRHLDGALINSDQVLSVISDLLSFQYFERRGRRLVQQRRRSSHCTYILTAITDEIPRLWRVIRFLCEPELALLYAEC